MLGSLLFLLFRYAHGACEVSCDCSSSNSGFSSEQGCCGSFDSCSEPFDRCSIWNAESKSISEIKPMLCFLGGCPSLKNCCQPYLEFGNVTAFLAKIPNAKKLNKLYQKNDVKAVAKLAADCRECDNYDALTAFYYNFDSQSGVCNYKFDSNFILFFLQRFYYFLDLQSGTKPAVQITPHAITNCGNGKPIDLLCPPCTYTNLNFGNEENALHIFNTIIGNAVISDLVSNFISILLSQVQSAVRKCFGKRGALNDTTFSLYADLLQKYLVKTASLVNANTEYVEQFIKQPQIAFVFLPLVLDGESLGFVAPIATEAPYDAHTMHYIYNCC